MVALGSKFVIPGGMGNIGTVFTALDKIQVVDLAAKTSSVIVGLPGGAYDLQAAALSPTQLIFQGGHGWQTDGFTLPRWDMGIINIDESGNPNVTNFATQRADARVYAPIIPVGDGVHAVTAGGYDYDAQKSTSIDRSRNLDTIETLCSDGSVTTWTQRLSVPRRYHSMQAFGGKIVVAGGTDSVAAGTPPASAAVDILDPATMTATPMPNLMRAREHAQSAICTISGAPYLLLVGGISDAGQAVLDVELYNLSDGTSEIVGQTPGFYDHDRIAVACGNILYVIGGQDPLSGIGTNSLVTISLPPGSVISRL
jgi:hypothetical protein